jgi:hypothetical protein
MQNVLETPAEVEFLRVVAYADAAGVPFIWVNDLNGLFPPSKRPAM